MDQQFDRENITQNLTNYNWYQKYTFFREFNNRDKYFAQFNLTEKELQTTLKWKTYRPIQNQLQYDDQIKKLENYAYRQNILIDQQQQDQEEIKFNYQNLQRNYDILNNRINQNKDFKLFEQIHEQMNTEFQTIKNNYKSLQDKIKQQEAQIEGLVAENSRLLIDLYNYQL
ncbi:hypothetical protein pb186bvf_009742 [Paramecium bursaria]